MKRTASRSRALIRIHCEGNEWSLICEKANASRTASSTDDWCVIAYCLCCDLVGVTNITKKCFDRARLFMFAKITCFRSSLPRQHSWCYSWPYLNIEGRCLRIPNISRTSNYLTTCCVFPHLYLRCCLSSPVGAYINAIDDGEVCCVRGAPGQQ